MEEVGGIQEGFKLMDINNKGKINIDELRVGLHKLGHQMPDGDLHIYDGSCKFYLVLVYGFIC